ncbi:MAG: MFS transporter [Pseudomonadota bacterium]
MTPFMGSSINIAFPSIAKSLHMDAVLLSWVATAYLLAAAVSLVPFGRLADIYGRKRVFSYGIVVFTITSFLSAISNSGPMLILFRIFQGVGSSMIFATGIAILISVFPAHERGKVLGINVAAVYTGLSMGPFVGGVLTEQYTWRSLFLINVPLGLMILFLVRWKLRWEWAEAKNERFDLPGSILYGSSLVLIMYGISLLPDGRSLWIILLGVICGVVFVKLEMTTNTPVFDLKVFRKNRTFTFSNLAALIHYSATFAITFFLSLYLQYIKGLSPQTAGLILISQPVVMALLSPVAGRLSDRIEPRIVASMGMALTALGLSFLTLVNEHTALSSIVMILIFIGFGYGLFSSPNTNAIMSSVDKRFYGVASGSVATMRLLGMMISMGIATVILTVFVGRVQITAETYPSFVKGVRAALIIFSALCFAGVFSSLARGSLHSKA